MDIASLLNRSRLTGTAHHPRRQTLSEAIDIIRGIWDVSATGAAHVNGNQYPVHGAKRGPRQAVPEITVVFLEPLGRFARSAAGEVPRSGPRSDRGLPLIVMVPTVRS